MAESLQYSSMFTVEDIAMMAHLGYYDTERAKRQPISATFRFYFPQLPSCFNDDFGSFVDYQKIIEILDVMVRDNEYRLIEFLTQEIYKVIRGYLDAHNAADAKVWVSLTKLKPDVPLMQGGATFVYTDLPHGATIVQAC